MVSESDKMQSAQEKKWAEEFNKATQDPNRIADMLRDRNALNMPSPTREMLNDPVFVAIWEAIKEWDVNVPRAYSGYCGANGSHVMIIYLALKNREYMYGREMAATGAIGAPSPRDLSDGMCFFKAQKRGDDTFTVVGQDVTAPTVVCEWIKLNIETAPRDKLVEALNRAIKMRSAPNRKAAD